jgi:imidazole glycerol-phosphate synthase
MPTVHLLDYVAGNIRSLVNAIERLGYEVEWIRTPSDIRDANVRRCAMCPFLVLFTELKIRV